MDTKQIYKLTIEFNCEEDREKYLNHFLTRKQQRLNNEWFHHLTRAYLYENPDEKMTYKEVFKMIKTQNQSSY